MISSSRKTRRGSCCPLVENRDEWQPVPWGSDQNQKSDGMGQPPSVPQIRLAMLKTNGVAVDFRSPERLSDNRTMSYGSESQQTRSNRKQGGMDEIHLFRIPRARKIRRDDRGRATRDVRRLL